MEPRFEFELDGVVGRVGGPPSELREAVELDRDGKLPLGVLAGDVMREGEPEEDAEGERTELLRG